MALLLNIDTATEVGSVCVSVGGRSIGYAQNAQQREHASFVHAAVITVLEQAGKKLEDIEGVAVTLGPGSYTGLRVGMATAKGFCYALEKPLIAINTLQVMAFAAIESMGTAGKDYLFCPMIDARRMEVFAAVYNYNVNEILPPKPIIVIPESFNTYLEKAKVVFFGNGSLKFKQISANDNAIFMNTSHNAQTLAKLAEKAFNIKKFEDISYSQPMYSKEFFALGKA